MLIDGEKVSTKPETMWSFHKKVMFGLAGGDNVAVTHGQLTGEWRVSKEKHILFEIRPLPKDYSGRMVFQDLRTNEFSVVTGGFSEAPGDSAQQHEACPPGFALSRPHNDGVAATAYGDRDCTEEWTFWTDNTEFVFHNSTGHGVNAGTRDFFCKGRDGRAHKFKGYMVDGKPFEIPSEYLKLQQYRLEQEKQRIPNARDPGTAQERVFTKIEEKPVVDLAADEGATCVVMDLKDAKDGGDEMRLYKIKRSGQYYLQYVCDEMDTQHPGKLQGRLYRCNSPFTGYTPYGMLKEHKVSIAKIIQNGCDGPRPDHQRTLYLQRRAPVQVPKPSPAAPAPRKNRSRKSSRRKAQTVTRKHAQEDIDRQRESLAAKLEALKSENLPSEIHRKRMYELINKYSR